jgi:AraC-like DNA-binding protein
VDPLSDVFSLLKVRSVLSARLEAAGPWAMWFPPYQHIKFGGVIEGPRWVWIDGETEPLRLEEGDFYLLTNGMPYCFASDIEAELLDGHTVFAQHQCSDGVVRYGSGLPRTVGTGGRFVFDSDLSGLLLDLLPPIVHIHGNSPHARPLRSALELVSFETETQRPGTAAMAGSLANIVLVSILRAYVASETRPAGWLGALADPKIGRALGMVHGDIARRWRVEDLASEVGMSRTTFAERFRKLVGTPPLEYLTAWRMTVARHALKTGRDTLATIATQIGYESETAFGLAFKKLYGESPGRYRASRRHESEREQTDAHSITAPDAHVSA